MADGGRRGFSNHFKKLFKKVVKNAVSNATGSSAGNVQKALDKINEFKNKLTGQNTDANAEAGSEGTATPIEQTGPSRSDLGGYQVNLNDGGERTVSSRSQLGTQGGAGSSSEAIGSDGSNLPAQVGGRRMQRRAKLGG